MKRLLLEILAITILFTLVLLGVPRLIAPAVDSYLAHFDPGPSSPLTPEAVASDGNWVRYRESEHFTYFTRPGDSVPDWAVEINETQYTNLARQFLPTEAARVKFYKHPSWEDMERMVGHRRSGCIYHIGSEIAIHSVYSWHPHELVHAVTYQLGHPPAFFEEGLAMAYDWRYRSARGNVHTKAREAHARKQLLPLSALLTDHDFRQQDSAIAYPEAGSFMLYLVDRYGADKARLLFTQLDTNSDLETTQTIFAATYGQSIAEAEEEWLSFLQEGLSPKQPVTEGKVSLVLTSVSAMVLILLVGIALSDSITAAWDKLNQFIARPRENSSNS